MSASKWKPYPNYKSTKSPVGTLPTSWDEIRFRILFETEKGKIPSEIHPEPFPNSIPYVSMEYLRGGTASQHVIPEQGSVIIERDELMILWDGSNAGEILKSKSGILSSTAAKISPKNAECRDFDFFSLKSMEPIIKSGNTGMGIPHVGGDYLKQLKLPRPPINERQRIAKFLNHRTEAINSAITRLKQKLLLLEEKRSALITQAVTKGLNPNAPMKESGIEWIDEIPEHWSVKPIKYSIPLRTERLQEIPLDSTYLALEHIESGSGKIIEESQTETVESSVTVFEENDVLFGKLRPYLAKVVFPNFSGVCSNEIIVLQTSSKSEAEYFQKLLISNPFIQYVNARTDGVKMPRASPDVIAGIKLPHPPISEMNEIGTYLKRVNEEISDVSDMIYSQIAKLQEYQIALISAAVTGKIDVRSL